MDKDKNKTKGGSHAAKKPRKSADPPAAARTRRKTESAPAAPRTPRRRKKSRIGIMVAAAIIALLFLGTAMLAIYVGDLDTIYPNVTFAGVDVGGMTITEAAAALESAGYGGGDEAVTIHLPLDEDLTIAAADALSASEPIDAAAELYAYGRDGGALSNLVTYLRCLVNGHEPGSVSQVDADYVRGRVTEAVQQVNADLMGSGLEIGETEITVIKGARSIIVDETEVYNMMMSALESGEFGELTYTPQNTGEPSDIDIDSIHDTVYTEPKNAEYDPETQSAGEDVKGVDFDVEAAKAAWDSAAVGDKVVIPLIITEPDITQEELNERLFSDVLAEKSTSFYGSSAARVNNIELACASIDGIVLNPGEEFSYNDALGERTVEAGYQAAGAYSGGEVVSEVGGGICQVSSTLYYCALYSNLEITARTCHYFPVGYVPLGLDATVSWGGPEFKFVNDRDYPIRISAETEGTNCIIRIYGTDVDGSYVEMTTNAWVNSDGSTGVTSYRNVYTADGTLISSTKESDSRYHVHQEEEESPSAEPTPSAEPSAEPDTEPTEEPDAEPSETPAETEAPAESEPPAETEEPAEPEPSAGTEAPAESEAPSDEAAEEESAPPAQDEAA